MEINNVAQLALGPDQLDGVDAVADGESLFAQIARWRNNVIDYEIVVDECRRALRDAIVEDAASDALAAAVRDRNHAAAHLAHLIQVATVTP